MFGVEQAMTAPETRHVSRRRFMRPRDWPNAGKIKEARHCRSSKNDYCGARIAVGACFECDRAFGQSAGRSSARGKAKFTTLLHHVTVDRLGEAFLQIQRRPLPGVDGVTWEQYAADLEDNLAGLHARLRHGA
jgi:hypothetical protein